MKKLLTTWITLAAIVTSSFSQAPSVFKHPGVFSSQAELDFIKSAVNANNGSPVIGGYNVILNDPEDRAELSYTPTPYADVYVVGSAGSLSEDAFRRDAHAAYAQALRWVVTGNAAYKDKAIQILNAWSYKFNSIYTDSSTPNQPTLEASWALPIWLAGAEIIKTYNNGAAGWSSADVTKFKSFVQKVLNYVNGPLANAANWRISKYLSLMAAGVFLDNASYYNSGYSQVTGELDDITDAGEIPELYRDFVHSQYVLIGLTQCAEIAHQQGSDALFTRARGSHTLLLYGAETYVKCLTTTTGLRNYQSASVWARKSAPYEILLTRYTQLGMSIPLTSNYVLTQNRSEDASENHFAAWFTATHAGIPASDPNPGCVPVAASANDGNIPENVLDDNLSTRWSAEGDGQWIQFCLGSPATISGVQVAFYGGDTRTATFDVSVSSTGVSGSWTAAATGLTSSGTTLALQTFPFTPVIGTYVRITGHGNSVNLWNSLTEVKINSTPLAGAPIGQTIWLQGNTGQYVSSKNGTEPMNCNATEVAGWNKFLVVDAGNNKIALQNLGKYVSSENGTQAMTCNRTAYDAWEMFEWIINANGTVSLKGNNGLYVSSENSVAPMTCNRTAISGWESFNYGIVAAATTTLAKTSEVTAYPNPVVSKLSYTLPEEVTTYSVEVKDSNGKVLYQATKIAGDEKTLDTSAWKTGIYYVKISGAGVSKSFRITK